MPHTEVVMLIGKAAWLHPGGEQALAIQPHDVITLVTLRSARQPAPNDNTIMVSADDLDDVHIETRTMDGTRRQRRTVTGHSISILNGLRLGDILTEMVNAIGGPNAAPGHAPLFCGAQHPDGWRIYSRAHARPSRWCFIRSRESAYPAAIDYAAWVPAAVSAHASHALALNSHHCARPDEFLDKEIEVKYTLPSDADIWALASACHEQVALGGILSMTPHFTEDFECREYDSFLYQVLEPAERRGYISFMTIQPNVFRIKIKTFEEDSLIRGETVSSEIRVDSDLDSYVEDVLRVTAEPLPAFRRYRYDINLESLASGHTYSIIFDRCVIADRPDQQLVQAEIEYIDSRRVLPIDHQSVLDELANVVRWCGEFLAAHRILASPGYYSKLTFLRNAGAQRG